MIRKVNLSDAFSRFHDTWSPKVAGEVNEMQVKLARLEGSFEWHHHEREDELFLVVEGRLRMALRDQEDIVLDPGELVIVPRGIEHCPIAEEPCKVLLFEPSTTLNTGNVESERTVRDVGRIE